MRVCILENIYPCLGSFLVEVVLGSLVDLASIVDNRAGCLTDTPESLGATLSSVEATLWARRRGSLEDMF